MITNYWVSYNLVMKNFTSLHTMTEYSFLQSAIKIDDLITFAQKNNLNSLVITDRNNMHGVAEFIYKCQQAKIKPIVGLDLDITEGRVILLAKNYQGYQHLISLATKKGHQHEIGLLDIKNEHIYIIDYPNQGLLSNNHQLPDWDNFLIGNNKYQKKAVFLQETKILEPSDQETFAIIRAIAENKKQLQIIDVLPYPLIIEDSNLAKATLEIIESCNLVLPPKANILPKYPHQEKIDANQYLKNIINKQGIEILGDKFKQEKYQERIKYELDIIQKLEFANYFLIIWDLVRYAKNNGIVVGPGRGSAAGSLVAYVLAITEIDPIAYDLLFERFLNPERISMPDIDLDIQDTKRDEVIRYLFKKYHASHTALISTFQKLAAKSSLRDVARILDIPNGEAIELTKLVPMNLSLKEAYTKSARFRSAITKKELNQKLFDLACKIEGLPRQIGTHAAGVVIAPIALVNQAPTLMSSEGFNQIQYAMDYLAEHNLLKIDVLGLRNLTILQNIQDEIKKNHQNHYVDLKKINLDDSLTNKLLSEANTNGIFQFESYGMKKTLHKVQVSHLDDLAAIVSLYRPGPMEFIDTYAKRKFKKEAIPKITPAYDQVVANTYGIIIYQEQIMQIAQTFANMSFGQADILRRAIGKKDRDLINSLKAVFIKGAKQKGASLELAEEVYRQIESFANYGFNKSHAVAYATLAYRLAFLKARFPFEFYTALIANSIGSLETLKTYINEAKSHGLDIVAPDITLAKAKVYNHQKRIILPLTIIKGLGGVANNKILVERDKKPFADFFELVARLKNAGVGESIILTLIKGHALRIFGNMSTLLNALPQALRYAEMIKIKKDGEVILNFALLAKPKLKILPEDILASVTLEKAIYGFNIFAFLTSQWEHKFKLAHLKKEEQLTLPILIEKVKKLKNKQGKNMAIITASDSSSQLEIFVFEEVLNQLTKLNSKLIVEATIQYQKKANTYVLSKPWKELNG